jgi:hypothetical protein
VDEDDLVVLPDLITDQDGRQVEGSDLLEDQWLSPEDLARRILRQNESRPSPAVDSDTSTDSEGACLHRNESRPLPTANSNGNTALEGVSKAQEAPISCSTSRPSRAARLESWRDGPVATRSGSRLKYALINLLLLPQYAYNAFGNSQPQVNVANIRGPHNKHQAKRIALSQPVPRHPHYM